MEIFKVKCFFPPRTLMHLFLFTHSHQREVRTGFNMYMRPQLAFLALVP